MNQKYQCPECGYVGDEAGNCPTCNVPLEAVNGGEEELEKDEPGESELDENY